MFALGATTKPHNEFDVYFTIGANVTETCYNFYKRQRHGVGAEKTSMPSWQAVVPYYILRPEVIESIFYMWRLTHDQKYRDWGREIANVL